MEEIKLKFAGRWKCDRQENLDEFMREAGINLMLRKLASLVKPTSEIKVEGDQVTLTTNAGFMKKSDTFKLGEEFDSDFQGEKMKITITYEDGKLLSNVTNSAPGDGTLKAQRYTREIKGDELYMELQVGDVVCKRYFKRLA